MTNKELEKRIRDLELEVAKLNAYEKLKLKIIKAMMGVKE